MELFNPELKGKPQLVAVNKMDLPEAKVAGPDNERKLAGLGIPVFPISAAAGEGLEPLLAKVAELVEKAREEEMKVVAEAQPEVIVPMRPVPDFVIEHDESGFRVRGRLVERTVAMTDMDSDEALAMLQRQLARMGVTVALERAGVKTGDTVRIGDFELEWV
jgi:GTP-binding protein